MRRTWRTVALISGLLVAACGGDGGGPKGPGTLTGLVKSGPIPVGAVVLQVSGQGIDGFSALGGDRLFHSQVQPGVHRVVLVGSTPGDFTFSVSVQDVGAQVPAITVVEAVGGDNLAIVDLTGIEAKIQK